MFGQLTRNAIALIALIVAQVKLGETTKSAPVSQQIIAATTMFGQLTRNAIALIALIVAQAKLGETTKTALVTQKIIAAPMTSTQKTKTAPVTPQLIAATKMYTHKTKIVTVTHMISAAKMMFGQPTRSAIATIVKIAAQAKLGNSTTTAHVTLITIAAQVKHGKQTHLNALANTPKIAALATPLLPTPLNAHAIPKRNAVNPTPGEPAHSANATLLRIQTIAAVTVSDSEQTILAVLLATKNAAVLLMTTNAWAVIAAQT